jgi:hypothetical protein
MTFNPFSGFAKELGITRAAHLGCFGTGIWHMLVAQQSGQTWPSFWGLVASYVVVGMALAFNSALRDCWEILDKPTFLLRLVVPVVMMVWAIGMLHLGTEFIRFDLPPAEFAITPWSSLSVELWHFSGNMPAPHSSK